MAQVGDTITYTYNGGTNADEVRVSEDVSSVDGIVIDYINGAGGFDGSVKPGKAGGRVENVEADVSDYDTLYIWVAGYDSDGISRGRYQSSINPVGAGSSSEVSVNSDTVEDDVDAPFIAGAGGGGGGDGSNQFLTNPGEAGARGGKTDSGDTADGDPPPLGGDGAAEGGQDATPGEGAVSGHGSIVPIVSSGNTITGGGNDNGNDAEIQITYKSLSPDAPSNVAIDDAQTEGELTVDWDEVGSATGYYVYRAQSSGSAKSDYTQVADVSSPPYVDQNLEDGERYYYRVSAYS